MPDFLILTAKKYCIGNSAFRGTNAFNGGGDRNIAIGDSALGYNIFGFGNIAIGAATLRNITRAAKIQPLVTRLCF